jgi:hypothetical protein
MTLFLIQFGYFTIKRETAKIERAKGKAREAATGQRTRQKAAEMMEEPLVGLGKAA